MRYWSGERRPESSTRIKLPKRAEGVTPTQPFTHKGKHRKNARPIRELQANQKMEASPWCSMENIKTSVDMERAAPERRPFDPTPRLIKVPVPANRPTPKPQFANTMDLGKIREWLRS